MKQGPVCIGDSDSMKMPHKKYKSSRQTFYVTQYPEGDYCIHGTAGGGEGYGGYRVEFLMEDGTTEVVTGPFNVSTFLYGSEKEELAKLMGVQPDDLNSATQLTFGRNLGAYSKMPELIRKETEFTVGDWRDRVLPEFAGMEVAVIRRGWIAYHRTDDVLKGKVTE